MCKKINLDEINSDENSKYCFIFDETNQLSLHVQHMHSTCIERKEAENFISDVYHLAHKANLNQFMSNLYIGRENSSSNIYAAIGAHNLGEGTGLVENYLSMPAQSILNSIDPLTVKRNQIVEIGNLAAVDIDYAKLIIAFSVFHLHEKYRWCLCTGTITVRQILKKMGIKYIVLEKADGKALGEEQNRWGTYYRHKPCVLALFVKDAYKAVSTQYSYKLSY